jgi:hypothetical protein
VDIQDHYANIYRGPVWSFTTECCRTIDDMEQYTLNPDHIYDTWWDGCGDVNGMNGNGTGSCVNLTMETVHGGAKAMLYYYECFKDLYKERDANYAEATREFDPALNLNATNEASLAVYFYGAGDNGVTDMWMVLEDGTGAEVMTTYGANGEDPADIQLAEWVDWNTDLADLGGVDLGDIVKLSIGFGDRATNMEEVGIEGFVVFDDIEVCTNRCVVRFLPPCYGDHDDDCDVDMNDVKIIADNWLTDLR